MNAPLRRIQAAFLNEPDPGSGAALQGIKLRPIRNHTAPAIAGLHTTGAPEDYTLYRLVSCIHESPLDPERLRSFGLESVYLSFERTLKTHEKLPPWPETAEKRETAP